MWYQLRRSNKTRISSVMLCRFNLFCSLLRNELIAYLINCNFTCFKMMNICWWLMRWANDSTHFVYILNSFQKKEREKEIVSAILFWECKQHNEILFTTPCMCCMINFDILLWRCNTPILSTRFHGYFANEIEMVSFEMCHHSYVLFTSDIFVNKFLCISIIIWMIRGIWSFIVVNANYLAAVEVCFSGYTLERFRLNYLFLNLFIEFAITAFLDISMFGVTLIWRCPSNYPNRLWTIGTISYSFKRNTFCCQTLIEFL